MYTESQTNLFENGKFALGNGTQIYMILGGCVTR
jgi:hypothetical protein